MYILYNIINIFITYQIIYNIYYLINNLILLLINFNIHIILVTTRLYE